MRTYPVIRRFAACAAARYELTCHAVSGAVPQYQRLPAHPKLKTCAVQIRH